MLVWIIGKDGLVGKAMMETLDIPHVGSSKLEADITDLGSLEAFYLKNLPTHIINCSAVVEVDRCEGELGALAKAVNTDGIVNLAHLAKKYHLRLLHISTDYVFDGSSSNDYIEEDETHAINVYGKTKLAGEKALFEILEGAVSIRTASLYGYGKYGLIDSLVDTLKNNEICSFVTDQISSPTYVGDLVNACSKLLDCHGIFHYVNGGSCSRFELLEFVKGLMEKYSVPMQCETLIKKRQKEIRRAAIRPVRSVLSTRKIEEFLNSPIRSWQDAVEEFFVRKWVQR